MPNVKRDAYAEYLAKRIPGARFFDLDAVCDKSSAFPHMLPTAAKFSTEMGNLGIAKSDDLCIYDSQGLFSAARVYWTFRAFGHLGDLSILEGGLPAYESLNLPVETDTPKDITPVFYGSAALNKDAVVDFEEVVSIARQEPGNQTTQILDARPNARFTGAAPEPRPGLSSGHIPHSISLPFSAVQTPQTGAILPPEELKRVLYERGVDLTKPIVVSCGTGVTACILGVALQSLGIEAKVYDESWTGYADPSRAGKIDGLIVKD